jgi:hypothetical protein
MAFVGETAPEGWLLCNGASFADNPANAKLRELLGSFNTPNLNARYLRGIGVQEGRGGITLKGTQYDELRQHSHGVDITTTTAGLHDHNAGDEFTKILRRDGRYWVTEGAASGSNWSTPNSQPGNRINVFDNRDMAQSGSHTHQVTGSTVSAGSSDATYGDTRPYSYGVNWIIKI